VDPDSLARKCEMLRRELASRDQELKEANRQLQEATEQFQAMYDQGLFICAAFLSSLVYSIFTMNGQTMIQALRRDLALQVSRTTHRSGDTQLVTARRLGIPQPTLSKIINGRVSDLSIELLLRVAVRAGLAITLQTGRDAAEAGAFVSGLGRSPTSASGSKLAREARQSLLQAEGRLTPAERLEAFVEHSELLSAVHQAGLAAERRRATGRSGNAP
jgi:predicted XRE-type DNA-binding protein